MFTINRKLAVIPAALAAFAGTALVSAPQAMAVPSGCYYSMSNRDAIGTCPNGTGQFRIRLDCSGAPDRTSVWANPKQMVSVHCLVGMPYGVSFETR